MRIKCPLAFFVRSYTVRWWVSSTAHISFLLTSASDMQIDLLAQRTRYLKETPEGVSEMCKEMEIMRDKSRLEGELKGKQETAINLHNMGMDNDFIAKAVNVSIDLVKQWLTPASA